MNSYNIDVGAGDSKKPGRDKQPSGLFQDGDLLVRFNGCGAAAERGCEQEMKPYYETWQKEVWRLDGKHMPQNP